MHPLPACASGEWGPMKAERHFNIIPQTYKSAIVEASHSQTIELVFDLPKVLKIHGKLHNNTTTESLDKFVKHEIVNHVNMSQPQVILYVTLPEEGQYGLDIYARDPEYQSEKRTMSHCCKYLINCNKKSIQSPMNSIANKSLVLKKQNSQTSPLLVNPIQSSTLSSSPSSQMITICQAPSSSSSSSLVQNLNSNEISQQLIGPNTEMLNRLGMIPINYIKPIIKFTDELSFVSIINFF
jgi:hypothetical protein